MARKKKRKTPTNDPALDDMIVRLGGLFEITGQLDARGKSALRQARSRISERKAGTTPSGFTFPLAQPDVAAGVKRSKARAKAKAKAKAKARRKARKKGKK